MFAWLNTAGATYKNHVAGETNYLENPRSRGGPPKPFPNNENYTSEAVLSEELRNEIYTRVVKKKRSVRAVSAELGVEMKRIAAVVRLVELENRQKAQVRTTAHIIFFKTPNAYDETPKKSISLEDTGSSLTG